VEHIKHGKLKKRVLRRWFFLEGGFLNMVFLLK
jgi:hypothetical protein